MTHLVLLTALLLQTEDQVKDLAERTTQALAKLDAKEFIAQFDLAAVADRVLAGLEVPAGSKADVSTFIQSDAKKFFEGFIKSATETTFRFLRVRTIEGGPRALLRSIGPNGLNYIELVAVAGPGGRALIGDVHPFLAGEFCSAIIRRIALAAVDAKKLGASERIAEALKNDLAMGKLLGLFQAGEFQKALEQYDALAPAMKALKSAQIIRMEAAMNVDEKVSQAFAAEADKNFPGDAALRLLAVDGLLLRGAFAKAIEALDAVDTSVGGDPYLHVLRAAAHLQNEDLDKAKEEAEKATTGEPTLKDGWWCRVSVSMKRKAFADVAKSLKTLEKDLKVEFGDLTQEAMYAEFLRSDEGKAWQKDRPAK